tara:strand:+ start:325 stop:705 length:381 start_codon:yes stop_codon:yes gene_type:complete
LLVNEFFLLSIKRGPGRSDNEKKRGSLNFPPKHDLIGVGNGVDAQVPWRQLWPKPWSFRKAAQDVQLPQRRSDRRRSQPGGLYPTPVFDRARAALPRAEVEAPERDHTAGAEGRADPNATPDAART